LLLKHFSTKIVISFIDNTLRETTSKTNSVSIHSVKENISNLHLFLDTLEQRKKLMSQKIEFFDLSTSSRISKSSKLTKSLNSRISFSSQVESLSNSAENTQSSELRSESEQIHRRNFSQTRDHSKMLSTRVHTKKNLFQSSHLKNLRKLFIFTTIIAIAKYNSSNANKTFSKEYSANASSISTRHFDYQSLQSLVQRNFDFLISILSRSQFKLITSQSAESTYNSSIATESSSKHSNFESNEKEFNENVLTNHSRKKHTFQFTTSKQLIFFINFFFFFSSLSFDSLFHQFRSSFSSNFFTFSAKWIFFNKFSINLDYQFSRIEKLNDHSRLNVSSKISSEISSNFISENTHSHSTNATSIMSIFEENASSMINLTQQNIQEIVLFMFNLFAQNVQDQTQAKIAKTINETIINIAKKNAFRAFDVKFFDSQLNSFYEQNDVVQINRNLYYRNVYLFVKRVKDVVIMSEAKIVRTNLFACLRESAQIWYIEELSDLEKKTLRTLDEETNHWCNALLKKFKKFVVSALNYLITERYILDDVRVNKNISSFVFQIMRHTKVVNIVDLHDQLIWVYNAIVSKLARNINSFDENTSTMIFLKNLEIKKNIWHRIYSRKLIASKEFIFFYQINFSNSANFSYDQFNQIYTSKQYRQLFENVNETRNYQKFHLNDNAYQKDKISIRTQENFDEYISQLQASNHELNQNIQSSNFETLSIRNQAIFAWRQNASQSNINFENNTKQTTQNHSFTNNFITNISSSNRSILKTFNTNERKQDFREKREQFQKFYDNREQFMKIYVRKENQNNQKDDEQNELFENIDSTKKNDRDDQNDQFVYNLNIDSSDVCKKCDMKRKIFKSNNAFHTHIRNCNDDETKVNVTSIRNSNDLFLIKSRVNSVIVELGSDTFFQFDSIRRTRFKIQF
jgi:hypothetical protein